MPRGEVGPLPASEIDLESKQWVNLDDRVLVDSGTWMCRNPGLWLPVEADNGERLVRIRWCTSCERHYVSMGERGVRGSTSYQFPDVWSSCQTCELDLREHYEAAHKEIMTNEEEKAALRRKKAEEAMVPRHYADALPETMKSFLPKMRPTIDKVKLYAKTWKANRQKGIGLVFCGTYGTGKTHAACALLNHVLRAGGTARYTTCPQMAEEIRSSMSIKGDSEKEAIERFTDVDLLAIDELSRTNMTDYAREKLFGVIDRRYANDRPTIVISNEAPQALRLTLSAPVWDRLQQSRKALTFNWESLRGREGDVDE